MVGPDRNAQGGISSVVNELFKANINQLCQIRYISTTCDKSTFGEIKQYLYAVKQIRKHIKDVDLVHVHMSKNGSFFRKSFVCLLTKKYQKKLIIHMHSSQFLDFYANAPMLIKWYIRVIFSKADRIIVLSDYWKKKYSFLGEEKNIVVLPNGVKKPDKYVKDYSNNNIVFLGKIWEPKGVHELIEDMKAICTSETSPQLYLGGDGEIEKFEEEAKQAEVEENIHFLGWLDSVHKDQLLRAASIFVLPSHTEGMPVSLLEGMAYGCACIASNVGGVPEIIKNEINGILIEPRDVEGLIRSLRKLLPDKNLKKQLGEKGSDTIEQKFDENLLVNKLVDCYKNILA